MSRRRPKISNAARRRHLPQVHDDRFGFGHLLDGIFGTFFAEAAVFHAPVRHQVRAPDGSPVDVYVAGIDFTGKAHGIVEVFREQGGGEAVVGLIGQRDRLVYGFDGRDAQCRAEKFVGRDAQSPA